MEELRRKLAALAGGFDGRVGIGVQSDRGIVAVRGAERFSLQSVMKLVVAAVALDAVDRGRFGLDDAVVVRPADLSLNVQPLADRVRAAKDGAYRTTIKELVFLAVTQSDSAATDILFRQVGGAKAIASYLKRVGVSGMRVDREERHLQTEIVGLTWRPKYVDPDVLERAQKAVPPAVRERAFQAYRRDPRDTITPVAMVSFLHKLGMGKLLSPPLTRHLLHVMRQTATGPDRLRAGTPRDWQLGNKTGTSGTYRGITVATNDVGILTDPRGRHVSVAVFVADSRRSADERAALIAQVARVVCETYAR